MVYSAPELLLIGAAQNLVLANFVSGSGADLCDPADTRVESDVIELW